MARAGDRNRELGRRAGADRGGGDHASRQLHDGPSGQSGRRRQAGLRICGRSGGLARVRSGEAARRPGLELLHRRLLGVGPRSLREEDRQPVHGCPSLRRPVGSTSPDVLRAEAARGEAEPGRRPTEHGRRLRHLGALRELRQCRGERQPVQHLSQRRILFQRSGRVVGPASDRPAFRAASTGRRRLQRRSQGGRRRPERRRLRPQPRGRRARRRGGRLPAQSGGERYRPAGECHDRRLLRQQRLRVLQRSGRRAQQATTACTFCSTRWSGAKARRGARKV